MSCDTWAECERLLKCYGENAEDLMELTCAGEAWAQLLESAPAPPAVAVIPRTMKSLPTGLGEAFDEKLLAGGLLAGEVYEVFGPPGAGKTQLGLTLAATCAASGRMVTYVVTKDAPVCLAMRIHDVLEAGGLHSPEKLKDALSCVKLVSAHDFPTLTRGLAAVAAPGTIVPALLVVDGLSGLLSTYAMSSNTPAASALQRWRLAWACRALRKIAWESGVAVLLLSHTVGSDSQAREKGMAQLALGQVWANAVGTRLELSKEMRPGQAQEECSTFRLTVRKNTRGPLKQSALLVLQPSGILSAAAEIQNSWQLEDGDIEMGSHCLIR